MITAYRRHRKLCSKKADRLAACRCPIWGKGTLEGKPWQRSLKTRSFERAKQIIKDIEDGKQQQEEAKKAKEGITVGAALASFIADCESPTRGLAERTLKKYKLLRDRISEFAESKNLARLAEFQTDLVREFRHGRKIGALASTKELERIKSFFRFCVQNGWIEKSPAAPITTAKNVKPNPRIPFDEEEIQKILAGTANDRELAFMLTLRHTGLRIGDASLLRVSQVSDGRIHLYTTKAGTPVSIKIPPQLSSLLKQLPTTGGYFFLWGESTHSHSVSNLWRRRIKAICKDAKIMPDHPHRFRHSLAADLLMKGASVEDVAAILGNSPAVVIKHYSQWIKGRQDRLDEFMQSTWEKPKLKLVGK